MTTRGRTLAVLATSMIAFGRIGGMREIFMAGVALAIVLGLGALLVWARGGQIDVERSVRPPRTAVGRPVRVELVVQARGNLGLGPVLVADRLPPELAPSPKLALPGGLGRRRRAVAYSITPKLRGRYAVGPVEITHTDPFGAVRRRVAASQTASLLVVPSYEEISVLPTAVQRMGVVRHSPLVGHGDEFYALRPYQEGDDLRKIHWPTTMRTGELIVRQEELVAEPRALIVLDTAAAKHRGRGAASSLEAAVSACASVGVLVLRRRMRLEIVTPDGPLIDTQTPSEERLLEELAVVGPSRHARIGPALRRTYRLRRSRPTLVVVISPELRRDDLHAVALRLHGVAAGAFVWIDAASFDKTDGRAPPPPTVRTLALPLVRLQRGTSFRTAWHTTIKDVAVAR